MSKEYGGDQARRAAELAAFDPHYVIPANVKGDLDALFEALDTVGLLAGVADPAHDVGVGSISALNHSLSALGKRLMGDIQANYPTMRGAAEA